MSEANEMALQAFKVVAADREASGRSEWLTAQDVSLGPACLLRLHKGGALDREVRKSYASVSVRSGFGGVVACVRRRAYYRLAGGAK